MILLAISPFVGNVGTRATLHLRVKSRVAVMKTTTSVLFEKIVGHTTGGVQVGVPTDADQKTFFL